jgi:hypothetical protein
MYGGGDDGLYDRYRRRTLCNSNSTSNDGVAVHRDGEGAKDG